MSRQISRIILSDNGVLSDLSSAQADPHALTSTVVLVAAEDAILIGSILPFNHRYVSVSTANTASSVLSVSLWDGSAFSAAVDLADGTSTGGKTFAQSGVISWTKDKTKNWVKDDTADVTGLATLNIYNLYWAKLTVSVNLSAGTAIGYVGHRFCDENVLKAFYPDLGISSTKTNFESGKTSWDEQLILATDVIIRRLCSTYDLENRIASGDQVLDYQVFSEACAHKTAEIVFKAFGEPYRAQFEQAGKDFEASMKVGVSRLDLNRTATLETIEQSADIGVYRR